MNISDPHGAVKLINGKVIDLDGTEKALKKLISAVKRGNRIISLDPDQNLGKEANVCLILDFTDVDELQEFIEEYFT